MLKLRELETRTQEIVFLFFISLVSFFILAGALYLYLTPKTLLGIIGQSGSMALKSLFHELGYAYFLLPLCLYFLGNYINEHTRSPGEILRCTGRIILQSLFYLSIILITASFLSVFQSYFSIGVHKNLSGGLGGLAGNSVGGLLFQHVGLLGSILILGSLGISIGVFSKKFDLVDTLIFIGEYTSWLVKTFWKELLHGVDYLVEKLGLNHRSFMRNTIEFEASSGTYQTISSPPHLEDHADTVKVRLEDPVEEKTKIRFEESSKPETVKIENSYKETIKAKVDSSSRKKEKEKEEVLESSSREISLK